jgi:hypothetical protein
MDLFFEQGRRGKASRFAAFYFMSSVAVTAPRVGTTRQSMMMSILFY